MAGLTPERQERGLIQAINSAVRSNKGNPVTVVAGKTIVTGVIGARKFTGRQAGGSEPYTDIVLELYRPKGAVKNLSCKGESAPSLAGGGLKGLELAVPGLARRFLQAVHTHAVKSLKLRPGDEIPDVYGRINPSNKLIIVVGNVAMGGPIDYMYIGPMDVSGSYDKKKNEIRLNGQLHESRSYAKSHNLYFRLRKRREDQRFDPAAKDANGVPKIYGVSPSRGDSAGRIVIVDKPPTNAVVINF